MTRRDRAAMRLALECLRREVNRIFSRREQANVQIHAALECLAKGEETAYDVYEAVDLTRASQARLTRARLALYLRTMLRAENGDAYELGAHVARGLYLVGGPKRYQALWELARRHEP